MMNIDRLTRRIDIANPIQAAVLDAEQASKEIAAAVTGAEKRAAVVEVVVRALKLRFIPKWLQRVAIGKVVDALVEKINGEHGHAWGTGQWAPGRLP